MGQLSGDELLVEGALEAHEVGLAEDFADPWIVSVHPHKLSDDAVYSVLSVKGGQHAGIGYRRRSGVAETPPNELQGLP